MGGVRGVGGVFVKDVVGSRLCVVEKTRFRRCGRACHVQFRSPLTLSASLPRTQARYRSTDADAAWAEYVLTRKPHPPGGRDSHDSRYYTDDRGTAQPLSRPAGGVVVEAYAVWYALWCAAMRCVLKAYAVFPIVGSGETGGQDHMRLDSRLPIS